MWMEMDVGLVMIRAMIASRDAWFGTKGLIAMNSLERSVA